jgi:phage tail-like protein
MEVKTIREGGNNGRQVRLGGPLAFGQLTLKRGMSRGFDLWAWFTRCRDEPGLRADAAVVMFAADRTTQCARFVLSRCVPVKLKAAALSAKDGQVAVEELQVAYESIRLDPAPRAP